MKKHLKAFLLLTCLLLSITLVACGGDDWNPTGEDVILMEKGVPSDYIYVYADGHAPSKDFSISLRSKLSTLGLRGTGSTAFSSAQQLDPPAEHEILVGETGRKASEVAAEYLAEKVAEKPDDFHWVFYYRDGKLAIVASDELAYGYALEDFVNKLVVDKKLTFKDTLKYHGTYLRADYDRVIQEQLKEQIEAVKVTVDEQREKFTAEKTFGTATENILSLISNNKWGKAPTTPIDEHPRLMFTKDDLPGIRKALEDDTATNRLFQQHLNSTFDGNLTPAPEYKNDGVNASNYNGNDLERIMAKALAYQVYGNALYGYQAIYAVKNYINTFDIQYLSSDQYRQYGDVAYMIACVYDWCYDLLTEEDKNQIIAGAENRIFKGSNKKGVKFEMGFPPTGQTSFVGHGAEYQLLRDYLSFAIAIYDENPTWYEYIGARFYNDFVPTRNYYFETTGIAPQGTNYLSLRHTATLYSAWIADVALGGSPYNNLLQTMYSFAGYEYTPGYMFCDGDSVNIMKTSGLRDAEFFVGYLFEDTTMIAQAESILGDASINHSTQGLGCTTYIILRGRGTQPAKNRFDGMELIQYNGSPLGQYVIREAWGVTDSAALFMKMAERNTANHEHPDVGHFQIYYKGMLTNDGGVYDNYGHVHTKYYHKSTIAHNSILVYNSSKYNTYSDAGRYYTGGQLHKQRAATSMEDWLSPNNDSAYKSAVHTGQEHAYLDGDTTKPLYAYLAGDMSSAYSTDTVRYAGRRMLAVYTFNEDFPLVFFVYDDVESVKPAYEKIFLLQISSPDEPVIDTKNKTVTTENGNGRLVLNCLSSGVEIRGAGGRVYDSNGNYDPDKSTNYLINGKQLVSLSKKDDGHWGRVEIATSGKLKADFMNVLYVTDKGQTKKVPTIEKVRGDGVDGGTFGDIAAVFATSRERVSDTLTANVIGEKSMKYYVSGVEAGTWNITVDGKSYGTATATEAGGLLTFTAPAGTLTITRNK